MLVLVIGLVFLGIYIYNKDTSVNEDFTFSESSLKLNVSACRILFKKGSDPDVTVHVSSRIQSHYLNSTETPDKYFDKDDNSLKMLNPNEDVDACNIELESSSFPDIEIICSEFECPITQDDDDLKFNGKLEIKHEDDADGNVYFKTIDV